MTWRELARKIMALPTDVQGMEASVWLPSDREPVGSEFPAVTGLTAYDGDKPFSAENFASINIEEA